MSREEIIAWAEEWCRTEEALDVYEIRTRSTGLPKLWNRFLSSPEATLSNRRGKIIAFVDYAIPKLTKLGRILE